MTRLLEPMQRDREIIRLVAQFKQLSSTHIYDLLFDGLSRTPLDRALHRLVELEFLAVVLERRNRRGGSRGGSLPNVYALGRRGYYSYYNGRYTPQRAVKDHTLAIADCAVTLRKLERAGVLSVAGMTIEDECWIVIDGNELRPDMYVEIDLRGTRRPFWIEVDLASESYSQVLTKLQRYVRALNSVDEDDYPDGFPPVLWAAVDAERAKQLQWIVSRLKPADQELFHVTTIDGLGDFLR